MVEVSETERCVELEGVSVCDRPGGGRVSGVNWVVGRGQFWVVGGGPGAGKSGLLMTMAGVWRPAAGRVRWFGRGGEVGEEEAALRLRVGLVFGEGGRLFHQLTLAENVALPICYHRNCASGEVRALVEALLAFAGLREAADLLPGGVRPAMRQRAALVRALGVNPDVVLVDDPVAGFGGAEGEWWRGALGRLHAGHELTNGKPLTLVVAAEELEPWRDCATHFAVLEGGGCRFVEQGTPRGGTGRGGAGRGNSAEERRED